MTVRALVGLILMNGSFLVVGAGILWVAGAWRTWIEWLRLAGLSYLLGVATVGTLWTMLLVVGVPFSWWSLGASVVVATSVFVVVGARLRRDRPTAGSWPQLGWTSIVTAVGVALGAVFFELLFRAGRLHGLYAFDAWAFWVPKGKAIYQLGGLDEHFFTTLDGPTYPPLVPILDAAAFHTMGSADVVTLHLQYWFLAAGFVAAVAGLLASRVPSWILWPCLLLTFVVPRVSVNLLVAQADFALQFFFATAVVLGGLWLVEQQDWMLATSGLLLAAGLLTKREGALLAVCLLVGLAAASLDRRRRAWPRLALLTLALVLAALPWRLWYRAHGIGGEVPGELAAEERAGRALRLSLEVFFDPSLFSIVAPLGVAAILVAAVWGSRRLALHFGLVCALLVLGGAWITAAYPELPFSAEEAVNPIVRFTVAPVLLLGIGAPLLLATVWTRAGEDAAS